MARAPKQQQSTAIAKWDEELAAAAAVAAEMEAHVGGGNFLSTKGGQLSWQGTELPDSQVAAIILDARLENAYYQAAYDPDAPASPTCYALGTDEKSLEPHSDVPENQRQCHNCAECPQNQFGTAERGRGKACRNARRLALIVAGQFDGDDRFSFEPNEVHFEKTDIGILKIPPTSLRGYANFVKQLASLKKLPPFAVATRIVVRPDKDVQMRIEFSVLDRVPNELLAIIKTRREEAQALLDTAYQMTPAVAPQKSARGPKNGAVRNPQAPSAAPRGRKY